MGREVWVRKDGGGFKPLENCGDVGDANRTFGKSYLAVVCDKCGSEILLPEVQGTVTIWDNADSLFDMIDLDDEVDLDDAGEKGNPAGGTIMQFAYHGKCPKCGSEMDSEVSVQCEHGGAGDELLSFRIEVIRLGGCKVKEAEKVDDFPIAPLW